MAVELGTAYISIAASTKGFSKDVKRALGDVEGEAGRTGKSAGRSLSSGLGKGLKVAAGAAAGVAAVIGGIALKGGFSRALNIEDAQAKLSGLGHDAKSVQTIMDSALASVKGTAFGLGDAATVAASTVAAGVKPGQDLTRTLKLVADASTIAGTSMSDMGLIFNKVAGTGKIQGEVIAQLGERGIPILQLLADEMGVSAAEVAKLASAGKVGFTEFQNAMEKGMGGAALKSGETFRGSLANIGAALGRLGEKFASPALESLKGAFNDAIPAIDAVTAKVGPLAAALADKIAPAVTSASKAFFGWITRLAEGGVDLSGFTSLLSPLGAALRGLMPALSALGTEIGGLAVQLGQALAPVLPVIVSALAAILTAVTPLLPVLGQALGSVIAAVAPIIATLAGVIQRVVEAVVPLLPPIVELAASALPILADIVTRVLGALAPLLPVIAEAALALLPALAQIITSVLEAITPLLPLVGDLVDAFLPLIPVILDLVEQALPLVQQNLEILLPVITGVIGVLAWLVGGFLKVQASVASVVLPALRSVIQWLSNVIGAVVSFVTTWAARIGKFASDTGRAIGDAIQWFKDLPGKIQDVFSNAGSWLTDAGGKIIGGLVDGLKGGFDWVKDTLGDLTSHLPNWKGPAKRDASILTPAGRLLMKGLVAGITESRDLVKRSLEGLTSNIVKWQEVSIKRETDRLVKARQAANKRLKRAGKATLPTLTRDEAEKQAKKNLKHLPDAVKKAQAAVAKQASTTKSTWAGGTRKGTDALLAGLTSYGSARSGQAGKAARSATLADIGRARELVGKQLDAARGVLDDMRKARADLAASIASSIKGELDLTAAIGETTTDQYGRTTGGKTTFASVAAQVKSMAAKAKKFAQMLGKLAAKGIPAGLIQEVASLGTEQGLAVGNALLTGSSAEIKSLSADYASLGSWSDKAGQYVASAMYDAGIAAQEGIIRGLEADDAKLEKAAKKLASKLEKAVKKALGIKSPSRLFRDEVGLMLSAGVVAGLDKGQPALDRRMDNLVSAPSVGDTKAAWGSKGDRSLTDGDIEALVLAMQQARFETVMGPQTAKAATMRGIQEIRRTDPAVLTGGR